ERLEDRPGGGLAVDPDLGGGLLEAHEVLGAVNGDDGGGPLAGVGAGLGRGPLDREGGEGGVAGRIVDRIEAEHRNQVGGPRFLAPATEASDFLVVPRQPPGGLGSSREPHPRAKKGEVAALPPGRRGRGRRRGGWRRLGGVVAAPPVAVSQAIPVHPGAERVAGDAERGGGAADVAPVVA